jgi:hypothetical protein
MACEESKPSTFTEYEVADNPENVQLDPESPDFATGFPVAGVNVTL